MAINLLKTLCLSPLTTTYDTMDPFNEDVKKVSCCCTATFHTFDIFGMKLTQPLPFLVLIRLVGMTRSVFGMQGQINPSAAEFNRGKVHEKNGK